MAFHDAVLEEILEERVVSSRQRWNPRGIKRKMSNYLLRSGKRQKTFEAGSGLHSNT